VLITSYCLGLAKARSRIQMIGLHRIPTAGTKMLGQLALNVLAVCYLVELCCFSTLII
jgi:hypothetical protein